MKQQHGNYDTKNYNKGINSDVNKELLGLKDDGSHVDSLNMRSMSMDGTNLGKKHIGGELSHFPALDNRYNTNNPVPQITDFSKYHCMMTEDVNGKIVEIWCNENYLTTSKDETKPPFIRVDGVIYAMSNSLPIYYDKPLQYDKNEHVLGGEIYVTNFFTPPMIFNVQNLINSVTNGNKDFDPTKYFNAFNINQYTISVASNLYKPQFIDTTTSVPSGASVLGSSSGLPVGQYSYSYRYVNASGDFSSLSPLSDLIPVFANNLDHPKFPDQFVSSDHPDISTPTSYAPYIRLRYNNNNSFASIQIIRHSWQSGETIGTPPVSYIIHTEDISSTIGMSVFSFVDRQNTLVDMTPITYEESNTDVTSITAAKSLRFFNKRLYLMNLKYSSKDIGDELGLDQNKSYIFPTIQKLYQEGHSNAYNAACYKSYMRSERQSYGIVLYDENGSPTYVEPIPTGNINNRYEHPKRRDTITAETKGTSYEGAVTAFAFDSKTTDITHEVFDHERAVSRNVPDLKYDIGDGRSSGDDVLHPVSQSDSEFEYGRPNVQVRDLGGSTYSYDPKCFGLDYYSLGIAVKDIQIPPGFSGFSIVKTESVKRVVAQGCAMYSDSSAKISVYFPDLQLINPTAMASFLSSPTSFKIQVSSSLGYFTEVYSFLPDASTSTGIDAITYTRILNENGLINPNVSGYVTQDDWISSRYNIITSDPNTIIDILSASEVQLNSGAGTYIDITVDGSIYPLNTDTTISPMYIVNLIQETDVSEASIVEYTSTGHFQKYESLIAEITTQENSSFELVSERWEDCIPQIEIGADNNYNAYSGLERYLFIEDANGNRKRWINVTYKSTPQITSILDSINANGYYTDTRGNNVYGVYKNTTSKVAPSNYRYNTIDFNHFDNSYNKNFFIPTTNSKVYVIYDKEIPVRVFGGDTYINESVWAYQDNAYTNGGAAIDSFQLPGNYFGRFPFTAFQIAPTIKIVKDTKVLGSTDYLTSTDWALTSGEFRQIINMFTAETRSPLCFSFNNDESVKNEYQKFFPLKNYIPRPYKWTTGNESDASLFMSDNLMSTDYSNAYGFEWDYWNLGGFRYKQTINQDYANNNNSRLLTSVPSTGFEEQTDYPTRIAWSEVKQINQQNSPSTKTYLPSSIYDLSDNNGEIKFAWSCLSEGKGFNLYAVTDNGTALILVDKRIINDTNASELFTGSAVNEGVKESVWISQSIGMNYEMWRSWAEYDNMLFFCNKTGVYMFSGNQFELLSENNGFQEIYLNRVLPYISEGVDTKLSGVFNILNKEYIMNFDISNVEEAYTDLIPKSLIYGVQQKALQCRSDYDYDKYLSMYNSLYGMKKGETFKLGSGNQIDGITMISSVANASAGDKTRYSIDPIYQSKEFIRIRVNSNHKPTKIYFFDDYENYLSGNYSSVVDSTSIAHSIKDYGGYECYIPRKNVAPNLRQQGRLVIFRVENEINEDFTINATMVQFKLLK
jgi:hypothetical protein